MLPLFIASPFSMDTMDEVDGVDGWDEVDGCGRSRNVAQPLSDFRFSFMPMPIGDPKRQRGCRTPQSLRDRDTKALSLTPPQPLCL